MIYDDISINVKSSNVLTLYIAVENDNEQY